MVSIRHNNLRLVIYPNDHGPPHVHVVGPDFEVKVDLHSLEIMSTRQPRIKVSSAKRARARRAVASEQALLWKLWRAMHETTI